MDEKELIDGIFKNVPEDLGRTVLSFMDIGTVLYLCKQNDPVNGLCTENFWKRRVYDTIKISKDGWVFLNNYVQTQKQQKGVLPTWRDMALELYLRSLENQKHCFECSQYDSTDRIHQCEDCGVDLCALCGDSELNLCMSCKEAEDEV
jgi:hypothetical protein